MYCSCGVMNTDSISGSQVPAHIGQLKFEFEIRHGAQAAHDHGQAVLPREVDRQARIAHDLDIGHVGQHAPGHVDPLVRA